MRHDATSRRERTVSRRRSRVTFIKHALAATMLALFATDAGLAQQAGSEPKKPAAARAGKKTIAASASGHARDRHRETGLQAIAGPSTNAVGQTAKSAAPAPGPDAGSRTDSQNAASVATRTAPGTAVPAVATPTPVAVVAPVVAASNPARAVVDLKAHGAINGTGMLRLGTGPAAVGGPAPKSASVNGTSLRPKH
jgi:hypothetical protein